MAPSPSSPPSTMPAVRLPGDSTVEHVTVSVPVPAHGQVLVRVRASSICGSDLRAIYREHLGHGAEAYQGVIAGHEPCGQVVALGPGTGRLAVGDRVVVYHITGCQQCEECRRGYPVGCTSPGRAAHGWQRDGGHADYLLAEERSCLVMPDSMTYVDGALVSCGFGTAYEGLLRARASGRDRLLVTGLGPVGLATAMLGRLLGVRTVIGMDVSAPRARRAVELGLVDRAATDDDELARAVADVTGGQGCEVAVDCSGHPAGREAALRHTRRWGRLVLIGEGGGMTIDVSDQLIHRQISVHGSWVSSVQHMAELIELLGRTREHPERIVTHRYPLADAGEAYRTADSGAGGKVCIVWED